ncbi:C-type lectin domain family 1 member B [Dipodomys spectabilis]|uniref:C-type lectin domain family 1 member B n=1 Tax=Dipodomys spectabilis TaxID=105255 RepID=UPI001C549D28|nr:C-type lectin domain family 1 member B [Dipodomys spectabilis]
MQDEDGYMTLNPKPRKPAPRPVDAVSSSWWRVTALILLVLSVGMLVGLVVLGIVSVTQQNRLHTENERMSESLRRLAKNFCQALIRQLEQKQKGSYEHGCSPCEPRWRYHGDSCYGFFRHNVTWEESRRYCATLNASLAKAAGPGVLEYIKARTVLIRWIGLAYHSSDKTWKWEDGSVLPMNMLDLSGDRRDNMNCAYFHLGKIAPPSARINTIFMCERKAGLAKVEHLP